MNIDSFLKTIHSREVELGSKVACDETFKIMFTLLTLALVQGRMVALIFFLKTLLHISQRLLMVQYLDLYHVEAYTWVIFFIYDMMTLTLSSACVRFAFVSRLV